MDERFRNIFNRTDNGSRSLPKISDNSNGKPFQVGAGSQGNIFQPVNSNDVLKFFGGEDKPQLGTQSDSQSVLLALFK